QLKEFMTKGATAPKEWWIDYLRLDVEQHSLLHLQECHPKGVSDMLMAGAGAVVDAAMHTSERMVRQAYDRRRVDVSKPVRSACHGRKKARS
ncbi:MAG: hypothetical protein RL442_2222, partial [Pseudomonadota bacterium]